MSLHHTASLRETDPAIGRSGKPGLEDGYTLVFINEPSR